MPPRSRPGGDVDLYSSLLSILQARKTCPVHEDCDGSCTGEIRTRDPPLQSRYAQARVTSSPAPTTATHSTPRDAAWLQAQRFQDFRYEPLHSPSIRLLKIRPAVFRADAVECELFTASLDTDARYNALSYTWGQPVFDQPLLIDGRKLLITAGLQDALKAYRQEGKRFQDTPLWVDAVCINQKDGREVNEQILLMRRIYLGANSVYVDLGGAHESWYSAYHLMNKLAYVYEHEEKHRASDEIKSVVATLEHYRLPEMDHPVWREYTKVFASPWFQRTWILQEIALAREAHLRYGRFTITWQSFSNAYLLFAQLGMQVDQPSTMGGYIAIARIRELCGLVRAEPISTGLMRYLRATNHFLVSDPRDKFVGISGLIGGSHTRARLRYLVDYTLTVDEIYHRVALHLFELGMTQIMLSHAGLHRRACLSGPSWVPDWMAQSRDFGPLPLVLFRPQLFQAATKHDMNARLPYADASVPLFSNMADLRSLVVAGGIVDTIAFTSEVCVQSSTSSTTSEGCARDSDLPSSVREAQNFLKWLLSARACLTQAYDELCFSDSASEATFARTLLVDDLYTGENAIATSSPIEDLELCYRGACYMLLVRAGNVHPTLTFKRRRLTPSGTFLMQAMAASVGKRFAVTKSGRMCLLPGCTEVGDKVVVFLGASVPFTVREVAGGEGVRLGEGERVGPDRHERDGPDGGDHDRVQALLVGDAYVDGLMDGEAPELVDFKVEDIELV